jgi:hypothetical protein
MPDLKNITKTFLQTEMASKPPKLLSEAGKNEKSVQIDELNVRVELYFFYK